MFDFSISNTKIYRLNSQNIQYPSEMKLCGIFGEISEGAAVLIECEVVNCGNAAFPLGQMFVLTPESIQKNYVPT